MFWTLHDILRSSPSPAAVRMAAQAMAVATWLDGLVDGLEVVTITGGQKWFIVIKYWLTVIYCDSILINSDLLWLNID